LKSELGIRPIYHQLEHRADAHVLIAFLAYCLQVTLKNRLLIHAPSLTPSSVFEKDGGHSDGRSLDSDARRTLAGAAASHPAGTRRSGAAGAAPHQICAACTRSEPFRKESGNSGMNWTVLESKMLSATTYDRSKQILYLRFRNTGDVYRYFELPDADYQAFLRAESKGRFFRSHIRDHFRYERMAKLRAA
jgi:hypothetical protein